MIRFILETVADRGGLPARRHKTVEADVPDLEQEILEFGAVIGAEIVEGGIPSSGSSPSSYDAFVEETLDDWFSGGYCVGATACPDGVRKLLGRARDVALRESAQSELNRQASASNDGKLAP